MSKGRENELKSGESLNTIFNIGIPIKRGKERKEREIYRRVKDYKISKLYQG